MKKALIVATVLKKHIVQFHIPTIKMLRDMGWQVDVAAANDYDGDYDVSFCDNYYDIPFGRSPLSGTNRGAYRQLKQLIDNGQYDVVHCHTPMGGFLSRFAAREARKKGTKVFYTAHGFHFFKGAPLKNWLLYYPAELICSGMTDVQITMNKEDYELALKRFKAKKVEYIPGIGIDLKRFYPDHNLQSRDTKVVMSTGELIARKNHAAVIRAIRLLNDKSILYRICGDGELEDELRTLIHTLGMDDRVEMMGYCSNIPELLNETDLFVLPSFQEGLPLSLLEAMACKIPVLGSDIRGNRDLLPPELLFDPKDIEGLAEKIKSCLSQDAGRTIEDNYQRIQEYSTDNVLKRIREIYINS